jgi:hypothetical protein
MPGDFNPAQIDYSWIGDIGDSVAGGLSKRWENQKDQAVMGAYAASGGDFNKMVAEIQKAGGTMQDITRAAAIYRTLNGDSLDSERFAETKRHNLAMEGKANRGTSSYITSVPDEYGVNQPAIYDRETKTVTPVSENKRYRPLTEAGVGKLTAEGQKLSNLRDYGASFQDSYAGMSAGPIDYGNAAKTVGQLGIGTKNASDAAQWWQGYDRYKNEVRKDLYGATLTPSEERTFESADIRAGMDPALITKNLAMQRTIIERGMKRKSDALTKAGFNPEVINSAYGIDVTTLKDEAVPGPTSGAPDPGNESPYPEAGPRPSAHDQQELVKHQANPAFRAEFERIYGQGAVDRWLNNDGWTGR